MEEDEEYEYNFEPNEGGEEMEAGEYEDEFQPTEDGTSFFFSFSFKIYNKRSL